MYLKVKRLIADVVAGEVRRTPTTMSIWDDYEGRIYFKLNMQVLPMYTLCPQNEASRCFTIILAI